MHHQQVFYLAMNRSSLSSDMTNNSAHYYVLHYLVMRNHRKTGEHFLKWDHSNLTIGVYVVSAHLGNYNSKPFAITQQSILFLGKMTVNNHYDFDVMNIFLFQNTKSTSFAESRMYLIQSSLRSRVINVCRLQE